MTSVIHHPQHLCVPETFLLRGLFKIKNTFNYYGSLLIFTNFNSVLVLPSAVPSDSFHPTLSISLTIYISFPNSPALLLNCHLYLTLILSGILL